MTQELEIRIEQLLKSNVPNLCLVATIAKSISDTRVVSLQSLPMVVQGVRETDERKRKNAESSLQSITEDLTRIIGKKIITSDVKAAVQVVLLVYHYMPAWIVIDRVERFLTAVENQQVLI